MSILHNFNTFLYGRMCLCLFSWQTLPTVVDYSLTFNLMRYQIMKFLYVQRRSLYTLMLGSKGLTSRHDMPQWSTFEDIVVVRSQVARKSGMIIRAWLSWLYLWNDQKDVQQLISWERAQDIQMWLATINLQSAMGNLKTCATKDFARRNEKWGLQSQPY